MARRTKTVKHTEDVRAKIQASQLVNRLSAHALRNTEMSQTQIRAAEILLKKTLPDLATIAVGGIDGGPLILKWADE